jgi:putative ATP-dependent endonuclease of the OLD family
MNFHISKVKIQNYRNFHNFTVNLSEKAVIVGENGSGKTNFLNALRLLLDPTLPNSQRMLEEDDFWDGIEDPMANGEEIIVEIEFQGFQENERMLALIGDFSIDVNKARIIYRFFPQSDGNYNFEITGGSHNDIPFDYQAQRSLPLQILPALRNAEIGTKTGRSYGPVHGSWEMVK